jgi:hypothetical protein
MTTLYEKRGRRYAPVRDLDAYGGLSNGSWLVVVDNGRTSIRRLLDPAHAEVEAAARTARQAMIEAMNRRAKLDLDPRAYRDPDKARRAWAAWCDVMGEEATVISVGPCVADIVDAGIAALVKKAREENR